MIDQLAESYHSTSPYAYVLNNPIMMTDPDGRYAMPEWIKPLWNQTPNGMNSSWTTNGNGFDFKGYIPDSRYSELSMDG